MTAPPTGPALLVAKDEPAANRPSQCTCFADMCFPWTSPSTGVRLLAADYFVDLDAACPMPISTRGF